MIDLNSKSMVGDRINALVDDAIYLEHVWNPPRDYLGISVAGHSCDRHVQYRNLVVLRQIPDPPIDPRIRRIFDRGHYLEAKAREFLKGAGFIFYDDLAEISDFDGKLKGHVDGVIVGFQGVGNCPIPLPCLWEHKGLAAKYAKAAAKDGLQKYSSTYWGQAHLYMHYFGLAQCLYTITNADDMTMEHSLFPADPAEAELLKAKVARVFTATEMGELLPRCTSDPAFYLCSWCPFREVCWK